MNTDNYYEIESIFTRKFGYMYITLVYHLSMWSGELRRNLGKYSFCFSIVNKRSFGKNKIRNTKMESSVMNGTYFENFVISKN